MGKQFHGVKKGYKVGVFDSWAECEKSVKGFSGALHKAFHTKEEAEAYVAEVDYEAKAATTHTDCISAFCTGYYDYKSEKFSWGVIIVDLDLNEHQICGSRYRTKYAPAQKWTSEAFGIVESLAWAIDKSYNKIRIYNPYEGLGKLISGEWKAKSEFAKDLVRIYETRFDCKIDIEFEGLKGNRNNTYIHKAENLAYEAMHHNVKIPSIGDNWFSPSHFTI